MEAVPEFAVSIAYNSWTYDSLQILPISLKSVETISKNFYWNFRKSMKEKHKDSRTHR